MHRALQTQARVPHRAKYFNASHGIWEQPEYKEPQPYTLPRPRCPWMRPCPWVWVADEAGARRGLLWQRGAGGFSDGSIQQLCLGVLQVAGLFALQWKGELEWAQQLESYEPHGSWIHTGEERGCSSELWASGLPK